MVKRKGFEVPIGQRIYDKEPIRVEGLKRYQQEGGANG